ncbi:hypothetical protein F511_35684 [Dorcoceras hygrometricum]|uniref:Uncharacterized protein n=1 Tax=Dorcoceras hygrometricum TaxID=472368 RepID=A0A2Z7CT21_9LAMI|nr:hypothetical protein F511_35684 [Dorcoceras hygrometricum]
MLSSTEATKLCPRTTATRAARTRRTRARLLIKLMATSIYEGTKQDKMRCLNGTRKQASNTVFLDENNRAKLVKEKPARTKEYQLGEEKIGSRDLVKLDAYGETLEETRMQEFVIMNNVDAYDDVKIT